MSTGIPQCAIDLIKVFEDCERKLPEGNVEAYPDPISGWGLPTIGWGTTRYPDGSCVKQGDVITAGKAEECLMAELERICLPELEKIPKWNEMNDNQRGALYSFAYNLGAHFYGGRNFQSITKVCDSPELWADSEWIEDQFVKYCNPGTPAEKGLRRRREDEARLFCTPVQAMD